MDDDDVDKIIGNIIGNLMIGNKNKINVVNNYNNNNKK